MTFNSTELDNILRRLSSASQGRNNAGSTNQVPKLSIREAVLYREHEKKRKEREEKERKEQEEKEEKMALIVANASVFTAPAVYGFSLVNSA
ncbi:hypothetical protein ACHAO8_010096 [Botrytis cinerea]